MISVNVTSNIDKIAQSFDKLAQGQIPYAASLAINRVAEFAVSALKSNMQVVFDRPKPFVLNSLFVKRSSKTNLTATIFHSDRVAPYLEAEIEGGTRLLKPFEINVAGGKRYVLVPTNNVKHDSYGGVSKATIAKILSQAKPLSARTEYAIVLPGESGKLDAGLYQRVDNKIVMLFAFKPRAEYKPRYDMAGVVQRTVDTEFGKQFIAQMDYALSTAK